MDINHICRHEIVTVDSTATLREAAARMREHHVGALIVTVREADVESAIGVLTDRDLAVEVLARELDPGRVTAGALASRNPVSIREDAGVGEAVALMHQAGVRRLLVTGQHGELRGIVSADDLLEVIAGDLAQLSAALRQGIVQETARRRPVEAARPRRVFMPYGTPGMQIPSGQF